MRTLYLIRHGHPESGGGKSRCISKTDVPLDELGLYQAELLREWARNTPVTAIFSSPLKRCTQTAYTMSGGQIPVIIDERLSEMDVGLWEGLTFDEIRARYPEEYAARSGRLGTIPPPGGESMEQAGKRLIRCLDELLRGTQGDITVITHGGINRGALCKLMGQDPDKALEIPQPYGGISTLKVEEHGQYTMISAGIKPGLLSIREAIG